MADTTTENYDFIKIEYNSSRDTWGTKLNSNWDTLDAALAAVRADLTAAITDAQYRVGQLYLSTSDTDPATTLGYGTWVAFGEGRALVGAGGGRANGDEFGADTKSIVEPNLPVHSHSAGTLSGTAQSAGDHTHTVEDYIPDSGSGSQARGGTNEGVTTTRTTSSSGAHTHSVTVTGSTASAGSGVAFDVTQKSVAVYVWLRTA